LSCWSSHRWRRFRTLIRIHDDAAAASVYFLFTSRPIISFYFVSEKIAVLVFLQTIWHVFKLVIDRILVRRHPEMRCCEGCQRSDSLTEEMEDETRQNRAYVTVSNQAEEALKPGASEGW
jgi:hypothetical protein